LAGKSEYEGVQRFRESLRRTLSCIVRGAYVDVKGGYYPSRTPHPLTLMDGLPVELGGGTGLSIKVSQQYRLIEAPSSIRPWRVSTVAYHYTLQVADGAEIISYQWHPRVPNSVGFPHLHIRQGAGLGREEFQRAHLPTGRVALENFVRLLIVDFGVPPEKDNWEDELAKSLAEFEADRSW
jgi:hypothetical protein